MTLLGAQDEGAVGGCIHQALDGLPCQAHIVQQDQSAHAAQGVPDLDIGWLAANLAVEESFEEVLKQVGDRLAVDQGEVDDPVREGQGCLMMSEMAEKR